MKKNLLYFSAFMYMVIGFIDSTYAQKKTIGLFDAQADVGKVLHKGSAVYNPKTKDYTVEGSGYNIWGTHDEFHFLYKKMKGNFVLKTNAVFLSKQGKVDDRKIGWMVRNSLDTGSEHVIGTVHGAGLTSLQYRKAKAAVTEEKKFVLKAVDFIQLERKGNLYTVTVSKAGGPPETQSIEVNLKDDVYVGFFVCSHDKDVVDKALFSNVSIK
jgi:TolB protein